MSKRKNIFTYHLRILFMLGIALPSHGNTAPQSSNQKINPNFFTNMTKEEAKELAAKYEAELKFYALKNAQEEQKKKEKKEQKKKEKKEWKTSLGTKAIEKLTGKEDFSVYRDIWKPVKKKLPSGSQLKTVSQTLGTLTGATLGGLLAYKMIAGSSGSSSPSEYMMQQPYAFLEEEKQSGTDEYGSTIDETTNYHLSKGIILPVEGSVNPPFLIKLTSHNPKQKPQEIMDHKVTLAEKYHILPQQEESPEDQDQPKPESFKLELEQIVSGYRTFEEQQQQLIEELHEAQDITSIINIKEKFIALENSQQELLQKAIELYPDSQPQAAPEEIQLQKTFTALFANKKQSLAENNPLASSMETPTSPPKQPSDQPPSRLPEPITLPETPTAPNSNFSSDSSFFKFSKQATEPPKTFDERMQENIQKEEMLLGRRLSVSEIVQLSHKLKNETKQ